MRPFAAVSLPDALAAPLAALQSDLPDPLRRTDPTDAHLTLTLLGEVPGQRADDAGFDPRDRAFTPHVTLARLDDARGTGRVRELVTGTDPDVGSFRAEAVALVESRLDDGPGYRTVDRVPLES